MSIATELAKLQTARNKIRTKLVALGLVTAAAKLDDCAAAVDGISNQGAISATVQEGDTYTIPAGYHNGSGTVSGVAGGGNYKLQSKTVAPTKAQQAITPDSGYYGLSDVTVSQIPDAYQDVSSVTAGAAMTMMSKFCKKREEISAVPVPVPLSTMAVTCTVPGALVVRTEPVMTAPVVPAS